MTLSVAIVGCGKSAENHVTEIRRLGGARLTGVCDCEPLMAEQFSIRHDISYWYSDFGQLLLELKPDVVHITAPPQAHLNLALQAIAAGCHVFVEKPLTENTRQSEDLVRTARANGCKLTVGWTYYFHPALRAARKIVEQGLIGDLVHVEAFTAYDLQGNFGAAVLQDRTHWVHRLPGKLFQNNLDHSLAFVAEFIDPENCSLEVQAWRATDSPYPELLDELRVTIIGRRTSANLLFSCRAKPLGDSLVITGSKGTLRVDLVNDIVTLASTSRLPGAFGRLAFAFDQTRQLARQTLQNMVRFARSDFPPLPGLTFLTTEFYKCIESGEDIPISDAQILRVCLMMERVVERIHEIKVMTA
ncbi:MAG: Gfo/Idh/MocA family oxidoreductase [Candidatus Sulfotelmatobacter sp.]